MELTIEQNRANYLKEMQRDNNIVASELKKYMDELGIQYKIESSVYIGIKICNKIIVELTDCCSLKCSQTWSRTNSHSVNVLLPSV